MSTAQLYPIDPNQLDYCHQLVRANMQPYLARRGAHWDSQRWLTNAQSKRIFTIHSGPYLTGFLSLGVDEPIPGNLHISDLQIDPRFQRQGLGTSVLQQCYHLAGKIGAHTLSLHVLNDNPAKALYLRLGFKAQDATSYVSIGAMEKIRMLRPVAARAENDVPEAALLVRQTY